MSRRHIPLLLVVVATGLFALSSEASAQKLSDTPGYEEIWKKSQALNDQLSMDTTPVEFTIGDVHYRAPRNYIAKMDNFNGGPQSLVSFKVSFPDFKPYSAATKDCFTLAPLYRPKDCIPITFNVIGSTPVSDDEAFKNASALFHSQTPKQGPYGYDMYETGPDNARIDTYRKEVNGHTLMIHCFVHDISRELIAVCNNHSRLQNENAINYILDGNRYEFNGEQFKYADQVDAGLRGLIESFTLKGGKQ